jgi:hypothetical protein
MELGTSNKLELTIAIYNQQKLYNAKISPLT